MAYFVSCRSCRFRDIVQTERAVMSHKERHEEEHGGAHTVEVEAVEDKPLFRGGEADS